MKKLVIVFAAVCAFATSCKKESHTATPTKQPIANTARQSQVTQLTFDNCGIVHNESLDEIGLDAIDKQDLGDINNLNEYMGYVQQFFAENNFQYDPNMVTQPYIQSLIDQIKNGTMVNYLTQQGMSPNGINFYNQIVNAMQNAPDLATAQANLNQISQNLHGAGGQQLNPNERNALYMGVSIALNTTTFWTYAQTHPEYAWFKASQPGNGPVALHVKWWKLLGDVASGVAGGFATGNPAVGVAIGVAVSGCID